MKKQVLIIGLGRFGASLAEALEELGAEVMGVDEREELVTAVADRITHSMIADTTNERVLRELGVADFDAVVCGIGADFEASLMTSLMLRELGAKHLIAKASTDLHGRVLKKIGADRIIFPERDVALRLAQEVVGSKDVRELLPLSVQHSIFELERTPAHFVGRSLADLRLRARFGLTVIAIRRGTDTVVSPPAEEVVQQGDLLLVIGDRAQAEEACREG